LVRLIRINNRPLEGSYYFHLPLEGTMTAYRIRFINELTNSSGHPFHCCQRVIEIRAAKSKDRAIQAAKHRFARHEHIPHWHIRAHALEVEEMRSGED